MFIEQLQNLRTFFEAHPLLSLALVVWTMVWKGFALWKAGRLSHKKWFIVILVLNTAGILDIIYLYFIARKYTVLSDTEESKEAQ